MKRRSFEHCATLSFWRVEKRDQHRSKTVNVLVSFLNSRKTIGAGLVCNVRIDASPQKIAVNSIRNICIDLFYTPFCFLYSSWPPVPSGVTLDRPVDSQGAARCAALILSTHLRSLIPVTGSQVEDPRNPFVNIDDFREHLKNIGVPAASWKRALAGSLPLSRLKVHCWLIFQNLRCTLGNQFWGGVSVSNCCRSW